MPKTSIVYDKDISENITEVAICFEDSFYNKTQKDLLNKKHIAQNEKKQRGLFIFSMSKLTFEFGKYAPHKNFFNVYHGCGLANEDGTRKLIIHSQKCLFATPKPIWKLLKTLNQKLKQEQWNIIKKTASQRYVKDYFKNKNLQTINQSINYNQ